MFSAVGWRSVWILLAYFWYISERCFVRHCITGMQPAIEDRLVFVPPFEHKTARELLVHKQILHSYMQEPNMSVVQMDIECYKPRESMIVDFSMPFDGMFYEMICFASAEIHLHYQTRDGKTHKIELHSAQYYNNIISNSPYAKKITNDALVASINVCCTCKTPAPDIFKCQLTVYAIGDWPEKMKSWTHLSSLEMENRFFMGISYSLEDFIVHYRRLGGRSTHSAILQKQKQNLPLSDSEEKELSIWRNILFFR